MTKIDLSQLRIDEAKARPKRPLGPRVFGAAVLLIALAVALTFLWPLLSPPRVVPTAAIGAANVQSATSTVATAEAVGWVEPDPFPTVIRPLVSGRIAAIHVLEGHAVTAGDTVLANLENAELLAAFERATVQLGERESEHAVALAKLRLATEQRGQHAELRRAVAEARIAVTGLQTTLAAARGESTRLAAAARAAAATKQAQERLTAEGISHTTALERARAEADAADAELAKTVAEIAAIEREIEDGNALLALQEELLAAPVDLDGAIRVADAEVLQADRRRASAATELTIAERELQWAREVRAPVDGVVMKLLAMPGMTTGPEGDGIVALYDPKRLRARLDVPLDSIAAIHVDQRVDLTSQVSGNTVVRGVVQRIQHESDLLKNTLQVKVALIDPPAIWRPETLCRARFLGGERRPDEPIVEQTFLVPRAAVQSGRVFVFDPARRAARAIAVTVLGEDGDRSVVQGELSVAQRVITVAVEDGESVTEQKP